jgi:hypothetical protein
MNRTDIAMPVAKSINIISGTFDDCYEPWRLARCFLGELHEVVSCALFLYSSTDRSLRVLDIGMGREGTVTDLENEPIRSKAQNGTPEEAKALLEKAVAAVKEDKSKALDMFNKGPLGSSARVIELGGPIHPSGVSSQ